MRKTPRFQRQTSNVNETIRAKYDPLKNWKQDPKAYFLIRVNQPQKRLEVALVSTNHVIRKIIQGSYATEIYNTIIRRKLLTRMEHAAYLGKELYKAELALKYGLSYRQDSPLEFSPLKPKVTLTKQS